MPARRGGTVGGEVGGEVGVLPLVLQEHLDLMQPHGTGLATYAQTLAQACHGLGFGVEALAESPHTLPRNTPALAEVLLHDTDAQPSLWQQWVARSIVRPARMAVGAPMGLHPVAVKPSGDVEHAMGPAQDPLRWYQHVHAKPQMRFVAQAHFQRWGVCARLHLAHTPALFHTTHPVALQVKGIANLVTIHDLVPLRLPWATRDHKKTHFKLIRHLCAKSDHVLTVSDTVRQDVIALTGISEDRITTTSQAVVLPPLDDVPPLVQAEAVVEHNFGLTPQGFFLFYGAVEPKKNSLRLIEAYLESGVAQPLVLVASPGWGVEAFAARVQAERLRTWRLDGTRLSPDRRIHVLPPLAKAQLTALIRCARALVFPSLYEGFGLPVVEAMAWGCPVITANRAAMPEVAGQAAVLVDPTDTGSIARAIQQLAADADLCADLRTRGLARAQTFTLPPYAQRIDHLYRRFL